MFSIVLALQLEISDCPCKLAGQWLRGPRGVILDPSLWTGLQGPEAAVQVVHQEPHSQTEHFTCHSNAMSSCHEEGGDDGQSEVSLGAALQAGMPSPRLCMCFQEIVRQARNFGVNQIELMQR